MWKPNSKMNCLAGPENNEIEIVLSFFFFFLFDPIRVYGLNVVVVVS